MTAGAAKPTAEDCLRRAVSIKETAKILRDLGNEWAAVCYFYAAYHTVKAAFIEDPIFDDVGALSAKNPRLLLQDRFATSHHGRVDGKTRRPGVNDIVRILYPVIGTEYVRLHMASVDVRYNDGLGAIAMTSVIEDAEAVIAAYTEGSLKG